MECPIFPGIYYSQRISKWECRKGCSWTTKVLLQNAIRAVKGLEHLINLSEYFETLEYRYIKTTCYWRSSILSSINNSVHHLTESNPYEAPVLIAALIQEILLRKSIFNPYGIDHPHFGRNMIFNGSLLAPRKRDGHFIESFGSQPGGIAEGPPSLPCPHFDKDLLLVSLSWSFVSFPNAGMSKGAASILCAFSVRLFGR